MVLLFFAVWWCRVDRYKIYIEFNKNLTKSHKPYNCILIVQDGTLTGEDVNHDENGVLFRCCEVMQIKLI